MSDKKLIVNHLVVEAGARNFKPAQRVWSGGRDRGELELVPVLIRPTPESKIKVRLDRHSRDQIEHRISSGEIRR